MPRQYGTKLPEEANAAAPISEIFRRNIASDRAAYARAWHKAELVGQAFTAGNKKLRRITQGFSAALSTDRITHRDDYAAGNAHILSLSTAGSSDRLFVVGPPYDEQWTDFQPPDAKGTQAHGPSADKTTGNMSIDLIETYVDRPVAEGGWMWAGAGVGIWFKPKASSTYVRVSGLVQYDYHWKDDSSLQVAHNRAQLGVLVYRWLAPGNTQVIVDNRDWLWTDGTSWYETHEDQGGGFWPNQNYFFGSSDDWYLVWFWMNGGIDFATKTTIGSSRAFQNWSARLPFVVFEQWA